jgi:hypothetical protein
MKLNWRIFGIIAICSAILFGCLNSRRISKEMQLIGFWNLGNYDHEIEFLFTAGILHFKENGECLTPSWYGVDENNKISTWEILPDEKVLSIQISNGDTLFQGTWEIRNIKYSKVPEYRNTILSFDLFQANKSFHFYR